jgi:hypothetical protein
MSHTLNRQQALEEFLNDNVVKLATGLYTWRGKYYEVLTYTKTLKRHNWSQFITIEGGYRMREASLDIIKKYYPKVTIDK